MKNFYKEGHTMTFTAPTGGVVSGVPYLIGALLVVATATVAEALAFEGVTCGVFSYTKTTAQAWTEGQKIYWNISASKFDSDGTTGPLAGVAAFVAANPSTTGFVRLNGAAPAISEGSQGQIAVLVDNSGGAAADGTIAAVSDVATAANAVKELATKLNVVIVALQQAGIATA